MSLLDNTLATGPVTVNLTLTNPTGQATLGTVAASTLTINPVPLSFNTIAVQKGNVERSFVRYVDLGFNDAAGLQDIVNSLGTNTPRLTLTFRGLDGTLSTSVPLTSGEVSIVGTTLAIDFGKNGVTGAPTTTAGDGYYTIGVDTQGNGTFSDKTFFRLLGDVTGDGQVNINDLTLITSEMGEIARIFKATWTAAASSTSWIASLP